VGHIHIYIFIIIIFYIVVGEAYHVSHFFFRFFGARFDLFFGNFLVLVFWNFCGFRGVPAGLTRLDSSRGHTAPICTFTGAARCLNRQQTHRKKLVTKNSKFFNFLDEYPAVTYVEKSPDQK